MPISGDDTEATGRSSGILVILMRRAKNLIKRASALSDRVIAPPVGITVLIYHRVGGGTSSDVDLTPESFDRQMAHLTEHHEVIHLDEAVRRLGNTSGDRPHEAGTDAPAVVITIDDGTADLTDTLLPILDKHRLPATAYIATRFIDEAVDFPWEAPPTSWAALRDAKSSLVTIASHTHNHLLLDRAEPAEIDDDLDRSIELIHSQLGDAPRHFAYPKALVGSAAAEIAVRRRFTSAAVASSRVNVAGRADVHRLRRTPIQRSDGFEHFVLKAAGGHRLDGQLRAVSATLRYRNAKQ